MINVEQYPSDLYLLTISGGGKDEDGFPIPVTEDWFFHSKCREIPAGAGNVTATESGDVINYASKVVMPLGTAEIKANTKIQVQENGKVIITGNVIRFSSKQLHCRLWV